jgi:hypothetical protein
MAKTLTVFLAADLKKFNSGMKEAKTSLGGFSNTLTKSIGPAFVAAGAAAGAFAIKLGVDGVKAAIEDEASLAKLTTTLENLQLAHRTEEIDNYLDRLEQSNNLLGDLRPAYDRLIRATRDTEEANRALEIALDISAGTGKNLETVIEGLSRGYEGNTTGLRRLGAGLDAATLKTGDMQLITAKLGETFEGQAARQANTFQGQLNGLNRAVGQVTEAFGVGFLEAMQDANAAGKDLIETLEETETSARIAGNLTGRAFNQAAKEANELTKILGLLVDPAATLGYIFEDIAIDIRGGSDEMKEAARAANDLRYELEILGGDKLFQDLIAAQRAAGSAFQNTNFQIAAANRLYQDAAARAQRLATEQSNAAEQTSTVGRSSGSAAREVDKLTKAQERLIESYELQGIAFQTTKNDLMAQIQAVEDATAAVQTYADAIQQDLLSGIDLGSLYEAQFDEQGNRTGTSLIEGFNRAIEQANYFGGVLTAIRAQGADQALLEQIAGLGPETGAALGQQLLDEGLVPEMNAKWLGVQETTRDLALGLVPEFLEAGRLSAIDTLNGLATQFGEDQRKFKRLGNRLGQQVGGEFKARMLSEIADAVRQVEALATAARAEAVARAEAEQARITEQAVASAISNLIRNSDQRAGRNVQPVLQ